MQKSYLFMAHTEQTGRGVFTKKEIAADTVIEVAPVIVMNSDDRKLVDQTLLHDYIFEWGEESERCCMALGLVPIYNHSYQSNCEYYMDFDTATILIKTVRDIEKGEELTINYNGDWNDEKKVWFEAL
jgi:uncharacterized protein